MIERSSRAKINGVPTWAYWVKRTTFLMAVLAIVTCQTHAFSPPPSSSILVVQQQRQQQLSKGNTLMTLATAAAIASTAKPRNTSLNMWGGNNDDDVPTSERIKGCVPYLLPLLDGDQFGKYIYSRFPPIGFLDELLLKPMADKVHDTPFLGFGLFLILSLGTLQNFDLSRNVRFNAQQAILIDILLILPEIIADGLVDVDVPRYLAEPACNFVWYVYVAMVGYSIVWNLRGKKPDQIPYISGYADLMTGPM